MASLTTKVQASDEIMIMRVSDYQQDQKLLLDSESRFKLPEAIVTAINHEIPLTFKTEIRLLEKTNVWVSIMIVLECRLNIRPIFMSRV